MDGQQNQWLNQRYLWDNGNQKVKLEGGVEKCWWRGRPESSITGYGLGQWIHWHNDRWLVDSPCPDILATCYYDVVTVTRTGPVLSLSYKLLRQIMLGDLPDRSHSRGTKVMYYEVLWRPILCCSCCAIFLRCAWPMLDRKGFRILRQTNLDTTPYRDLVMASATSGYAIWIVQERWQSGDCRLHTSGLNM